MMKRYLLMAGSALLGCLSASAFNISLKTVEELDSLDLGEVKVSMLMKDSVAGTALTDGFGIAEIKNLEQGEYQLDLEKEGFYTVSALVNLKGDADLGTFALTSTSTVRLDELVVDGARVKQEMGKVTVRPLKETIASSFNSLDVLRKLNLTGLSVNPITGTMNIYNKPAVLQVDGMERGLAYVMALDPARIEKIEYYNNPTARYMQSGVGGIINITLKKVHSGGSLYAYAQSAPLDFSLNANAMATYNYKDSEFMVTVSDDWTNIKNRVQENTMTEIFKGTDGYRLERESKTRTPNTSNSTDVSLSYQYNKSGWMLNAQAGASVSNGWSTSLSEISTNGSPEYKGRLWSKSKSFSPSINLYARKATGIWALELLAAGSLSNGKSWRDNYEETPEGIYSTDRELKGKTPGLSAEARYGRIFAGQKGYFCFGLRENYTHSDNDYGMYGKDVWDHSRTYGYGAIQYQAGKFAASLNAGVSYDHSKSDYLTVHQWHPSGSVGVQYQFLDELLAYATVWYDPTLPSISQRSNIQEPVQPGLVSTGSQNLKTEHYLSYQINADYRKNNWNVGLMCWISQQINPIYTFIDYTGVGQFVSRPFNLKNEMFASLTLSGGYNGLFNHLDISGQVEYFVKDRVNTGFDIRSHSHIRPRIHLTAYWGNLYITAGWSGDQDNIKGFSRERYMCQSDISVAYAIPHWRFSLSMETIGYGHDGRHWRSSTSSPYYDNRSFTRVPYQGNQLTLSVSYDLQFGRSYQRRGQGLSAGSTEETTVKIIDRKDRIER